MIPGEVSQDTLLWLEDKLSNGIPRGKILLKVQLMGQNW